jgi:hypothetical protein
VVKLVNISAFLAFKKEKYNNGYLLHTCAMVELGYSVLLQLKN